MDPMDPIPYSSIIPSAVYCEDPPAAPPDADGGGFHDWEPEPNQKPQYGQRVEYSCKAGRRLVDRLTGQLKDSQIITCQWNKRWSEYDVSS